MKRILFELGFTIDPKLLQDRKNIASIKFGNGLNEKYLEVVINKNLEKNIKEKQEYLKENSGLLT